MSLRDTKKFTVPPGHQFEKLDMCRNFWRPRLMRRNLTPAPKVDLFRQINSFWLDVSHDNSRTTEARATIVWRFLFSSSRRVRWCNSRARASCRSRERGRGELICLNRSTCSARLVLPLSSSTTITKNRAVPACSPHLELSRNVLTVRVGGVFLAEGASHHRGGLRHDAPIGLRPFFSPRPKRENANN